MSAKYIWKNSKYKSVDIIKDNNIEMNSIFNNNNCNFDYQNN